MNQLTRDAMFSSETDEWATPQKFFDQLSKKHDFQLDPCATQENAKCPIFFTKEQDGLKQDWSVGQGVVWVNPPYGQPELVCKKDCTKKKCAKRGTHCLVYVPGIRDWVAKAVKCQSRGRGVVMLLPSRTDTVWWHSYVESFATKYTFQKGRLKFGGAKNSAPFPSVVVEFLLLKDFSAVRVQRPFISFGSDFVPPIGARTIKEPSLGRDL